MEELEPGLRLHLAHTSTTESSQFALLSVKKPICHVGAEIGSCLLLSWRVFVWECLGGMLINSCLDPRKKGWIISFTSSPVKNKPHTIIFYDLNVDPSISSVVAVMLAS